MPRAPLRDPSTHLIGASRLGTTSSSLFPPAQGQWAGKPLSRHAKGTWGLPKVRLDRLSLNLVWGSLFP